MHRLYIGTPAQQFLFMDITLKDYKKWEEEHFPAPLVRNGVPTNVLQKVWYLETHNNNGEAPRYT